MFVDVDNLGDEALFLCECGSMSVLASNFLGCKSNSIYYILTDTVQVRVIII